MPKSAARRSHGKKKTICFKCEQEIKKETQDYISCDKCEKLFHFKCSGLSKREFEKFIDNESAVFMCCFCKEEETDEEHELRSELKTIKTELRQLKKLEKMDELSESIKFMSSKFDEMFKDVNENKKKIVFLENENKKLKKEVVHLRDSIKIVNDFRVKNDCLISGLKYESNMKPLDAVIELSKSIGVNISENEVDEVYEVGKKRGTAEKKNCCCQVYSKRPQRKTNGS